MKSTPGRARNVMITTEEISPEDVLDSVSEAGAGAVVLFLGTVRNIGDSGKVREMKYEAYGPLAERAFEEVRKEVMRRWPVKKIRIVHRVGKLKLKDISVAIAVSSHHRAEAFEACQFAIDKIKVAAPIWKKERLANGTEAWTEGSRIADVRQHGTR